MSLLISGDTQYIEINGSSYKINTDFRLWIELIDSLKHCDAEQMGRESLSAIFNYDYTDEQIPMIMDAIKEYLVTEKTNNPKLAIPSNESNVQYFDIVQDETLIIADFQREYNINLLDNDLKLSWKRFKILLDGLSNTSAVSKRIELRQIDLKDVDKKNKNKVRQLKEKYAINPNDINTKQVTVEDRDRAYKQYVLSRMKK